MNWLWDIPGTNSSNPLLKGVLNNWQLSGVGAIFSGRPRGVSCSYQSGPVGYPNGSPTGGIPFRCDQIGPTRLAEGTAPPAGSGFDQRIYDPINIAGFVLPRPETLGLGNAPIHDYYEPGFFNIDLSIQKSFPIGESTSLEFRMDTFNTLNHFNPSSGASNLRFRYTSGAQTRNNIGEITSTQNDERRMALSARIRF